MSHGLAAAAVGGHADDAAERVRRPGVAEADVAAEVVDAEACREILEDAAAHEPPVGRAVDHRAAESLRHLPERADVEGPEVECDERPAVPGVCLLAGRIHARGQEADLMWRIERLEVRELGDLARLEVDPEQVRPVLAVGAKEHLPPAGVPAGIREVDVVAVPAIVRELLHLHARDGILERLPLARPDAAP